MLASLIQCSPLHPAAAEAGAEKPPFDRQDD
jgi:hypothetical protein